MATANDVTQPKTTPNELRPWREREREGFRFSSLAVVRTSAILSTVDNVPNRKGRCMCARVCQLRSDLRFQYKNIPTTEGCFAASSDENVRFSSAIMHSVRRRRRRLLDDQMHE